MHEFTDKSMRSQSCFCARDHWLVVCPGVASGCRGSLGSCDQACVAFADPSSTQEEAADLSTFGRAAGG